MILVARMDTDDIAVKDRFSVQYHHMIEHPQISACGGWISEFTTEGTYCKTKKMPEGMESLRI